MLVCPHHFITVRYCSMGLFTLEIDSWGGGQVLILGVVE